MYALAYMAQYLNDYKKEITKENKKMKNTNKNKKTKEQAMDDKTQKYLIHFKPGVRDALEEYADGRSLSFVINRALQFFVDHHQKEN
jgi:hypothetical protein